MGIATDWTAATRPLLQAGAVKNMLAEDGQETGGFIHAFQADGTGGELDERRGSRGKRLGCRVGCSGCEGIIGHGWVGRRRGCRKFCAGRLRDFHGFEEDDMAGFRLRSVVLA